jgi:hypothetical protein
MSGDRCLAPVCQLGQMGKLSPWEFARIIFSGLHRRSDLRYPDSTPTNPHHRR